MNPYTSIGTRKDFLLKSGGIEVEILFCPPIGGQKRPAFAGRQVAANSPIECSTKKQC
jgi:hypothetical protein